jgi:hypothetical protein
MQLSMTIAIERLPSAAATNLRIAGVSRMKSTLFAVGCMALLDCADNMQKP